MMLTRRWAQRAGSLLWQKRTRLPAGRDQDPFLAKRIPPSLVNTVGKPRRLIAGRRTRVGTVQVHASPVGLTHGCTNQPAQFKPPSSGLIADSRCEI